MSEEIDLDNYDQVLAAVKKNGRDLEYVSERLRDTEAIVLAAIKDTNWALQYASERLRDDEAIVLTAVKTYGRALKYASNRLRTDKAFILKLLILFRTDKEKLDNIKRGMNEDLREELNI